LVVVTDGRANVGLFRDKFYDGPQFGEIYREIYQICDLFRQERTIRAVVVDAEEKRLGSFGRSKKLAEALNAKYYVLEEVISEHLVETVRESRGGSDPHYSK
jgi:Mg-chelatase subunit ChlD